MHKLLADGSDIVGEGSREHHNLLIVRSHLENLLYVSSHIWGAIKRHIQARDTTEVVQDYAGYQVILTSYRTRRVQSVSTA